MKEYTISFLPSGKSVTFTGGSVYEAMIRAGLHPDAPCGGTGKCGKCRVEIDGATVLACKTAADHNMTVTVCAQQMNVLTDCQPERIDPDGANRYVMALDVGTTTVAGAILDGVTGETLAVSGCVNPQRAWGADVITRIRYVLREDGYALRDAIRQALAELTAELTAKAGIDESEIGLGSIVCNTAMHHLLLDIDPTSLVTPPYMPEVRDAMEIDAAGILPIGGKLRILPNIAGFIGGDTSGCLVAAKFDQEKDLTLLLDIGTNGEMALGNKERRIACSAAAGPAFEGANISCGMSGSSGAVDHVWLENGNIRYSVIGSGEALGLCGSGLLDFAAVLLELGVISPDGRMKCKSYSLPGSDVSLTQRDIRQLQLAKGAIRAGICLMTERFGCEIKDIKQVKLTGAFGCHLSPASAVAIGMIPEELKDRIISVGNAAFEGAKAC